MATDIGNGVEWALEECAGGVNDRVRGLDSDSEVSGLWMGRCCPVGGEEMLGVFGSMCAKQCVVLLRSA